MSDALFEPWSNRMKASLTEGDLERYLAMQSYVSSHHSMNQDEQINYLRSRRRILRALAVNCALIGLSALAFLWLRVSSLGMTLKIALSIFILVIGVLCTWLSLYAYERVVIGFVQLIQDFYSSLMEDTRKPEPQKQELGE